MKSLVQIRTAYMCFEREKQNGFQAGDILMEKPPYARDVLKEAHVYTPNKRKQRQPEKPGKQRLHKEAMIQIWSKLK